MNILDKLASKVSDTINKLYSADIKAEDITFQKTRVEFEGHFTFVVFPFLKLSKKLPEITANEIGAEVVLEEYVDKFTVVKGFLNISLSNSFWIDFLATVSQNKNFGTETVQEKSKQITIEFSSPNTNKPLHLGHIRNILLGYSISKILEANGYNVNKVNLVNDRGIHICKSMLAWQKWGKGITPEEANIKGDRLVGDYYVMFDQEYKKQVKNKVESGENEEQAKATANLLKEAQQMLRNWEAGDSETVNLWQKMNNWVYLGFDETYKELGISFDKIYYESETYKKGKEIVLNGLEQKILTRKDDNSVWANLTKYGLDEKILLRADGTSVYMTQDLGTAIERYEDLQFDKHLYVVGNEQNYHFQVLKIVLSELGYVWADKLEHISYGMVELPSGKMKSREGTVVDADDLIAHMRNTAKQMSKELGKLDGLSDEQEEDIINKIALGALKYFILKVDPKKNMLFNPEESIDFNGNTGPFIQYTYARINAILRKAREEEINYSEHHLNLINLEQKEIDLIRMIYEYPGIIKEAGKLYSPAIIANYSFELVKLYNQFYHDYSILNEENINIKLFRIKLSEITGKIIESALGLLGIGAPEKM